MDRLARINENLRETLIERLALEIEAKAAKAALAVSSESMDLMKIRIDQEQDSLRGSQYELAEAEDALRKAKEERDKLKSRSE